MNSAGTLTLNPNTFLSRKHESENDGMTELGIVANKGVEELESFDLAVKSGMKEIGIEPLFFQDIGLTFPLDNEGRARIAGKEKPPEVCARGYRRLGYTVIHDDVCRLWERRSVATFTTWDGNSLPNVALSILKRVQNAGLPIGAGVTIWTPDRKTHQRGEVPDPMLVLEIGGNCYALCRWNG